MKLEFGCGEKALEQGFLGVDIRPLPNVSFVCNAWEIVEYIELDVVDVIFSRHFFEHLTYAQAEETLKAWKKVLKPQGSLEIIVPDMIFHIKQWLSPNRNKVRTSNSSELTLEEHAVRGFWGHQRDGMTDTWDIHKSGYDFQLIEQLLGRHGFLEIHRINAAPKNLHVKAKAP